MEKVKTFAENPIIQKSIGEGKISPDVQHLIEAISRVYKKDVDEIVLLDCNGISLLGSEKGMDFSQNSNVAYVIKNHDSHISMVFYTKLDNPAVFISTPIFYRQQFVGVARWVVSVKSLAGRFIEPVRAGKKGYAWLLDAGVMLSHPNRDHIGRYIMAPRKESYPDYDWSEFERIIQKMSIGEQGVGLYHSSWWTEEEFSWIKKVIAFAPVHVGEDVWSVGVSMGYEDIEGPINEHARNTFVLASLIILLFSAGRLLYLRVQKKRIALETEARFLKKIVKSAEAIRERETFLSTVINTDPYLVYVKDKSGKFIMASKSLATLYGMSVKELTGMTDMELARKGIISQSDAEHFTQEDKTVLTTKNPLDIPEYPLKEIDGNTMWFQTRKVPLELQNEDYVLGVSVDISRLKSAREQISYLTSELLKIQEKERRMLSLDLHDSVAQDLSLLKVSFDMFFDKHPALPRDIRQRGSELSAMLEGCIHTIRNISYSLRPHGLDHMGLTYALGEYCDDFTRKTAVPVDFSHAGIEKVALDFNTEINIYRIVQEALNNIRKHADANNVSIKLIRSFPNIILRIDDNGKGFIVDESGETATNRKGIGLLSIQERVNILKGTIKIESRVGEGTKIYIKIPYEEQDNGGQENSLNN